ncbi:MAG: serine hydrolase domain-containing protein [Geminicoccaceae bacterium]
MRGRLLLATLLLVSLMAASASAGPSRSPTVQDLQTLVAQHFERRREPEHLTGIGAYVSLGDPSPGVDLFVGNMRPEPTSPPISASTLYQIGSNTKAYTAAILLKLEAAGLLSIDDKLGKWLPEYPAWKDVTIHRLLDMTGGIPEYTETTAFVTAIAANIDRIFKPAELVAFAYPSTSNELPPTPGYHYSNTGYILAGMIAEKAGQAHYGKLLEDLLLRPLGLADTFYGDRPQPHAVLSRLISGHLYDPSCLEYEPECKTPPAQPLVGKDLSRAPMSWAGPAGAIIASPRDAAQWIRALFGGRVLPAKQMKEMQTLVSMRTGEPLAETNETERQGFGLGIVQTFLPGYGRIWIYEGGTMGNRFYTVLNPSLDLVLTFGLDSAVSDEADKPGDLIKAVFDAAK